MNDKTKAALKRLGKMILFGALPAVVALVASNPEILKTPGLLLIPFLGALFGALDKWLRWVGAAEGVFEPNIIAEGGKDDE